MPRHGEGCPCRRCVQLYRAEHEQQVGGGWVRRITREAGEEQAA